MVAGTMTFANTRFWMGDAVFVSVLAWALCLGGCAVKEMEATLQDVWLGGRVFHLELALDNPTRIQGLSDRKEIDPQGGMLFVFRESQVREFWMYHCLAPIDIIFLSPQGRIVRMHEMEVEPYDREEKKLRRYSSDWPSQFAIELRGGTLAGLGLEVGQRVDLPWDELKRRAR